MGDRDIKQDIVDELDYEPGLDAAGIVATVSNGRAILTGTVSEHFQKKQAENAVWRVAGVRGIVQDIEVRPPECNSMDDHELARSAAELLIWNTRIPKNTVRVAVRNGWLILSGEVQWQYQRDAAADTLSGLPGMLGMLNQLRLNPDTREVDVKRRIEQALHRRAAIDASRISVQVHDGKVILDGWVNHELERAAVREAAWSAPGVVAVIDNVSSQRTKRHSGLNASGQDHVAG